MDADAAKQRTVAYQSGRGQRCNGCCASPVAIPLPPGRFGRAIASYVDRPQAAMGSRHRPGTAPGPAGDRPPPFAPTGDPTPIMQVKVRTMAKSRVSIETRELRFPGN